MSTSTEIAVAPVVRPAETPTSQTLPQLGQGEMITLEAFLRGNRWETEL